jgi:hypothetical protein
LKNEKTTNDGRKGKETQSRMGQQLPNGTNQKLDAFAL